MHLNLVEKRPFQYASYSALYAKLFAINVDSFVVVLVAVADAVVPPLHIVVVVIVLLIAVIHIVAAIAVATVIDFDLSVAEDVCVRRRGECGGRSFSGWLVLVPILPGAVAVVEEGAVQPTQGIARPLLSLLVRAPYQPVEGSLPLLNGGVKVGERGVEFQRNGSNGHSKPREAPN
jgi:hypothetical protein